MSVQRSDVRGAARVLIDAIVGLTDVVEAMHANIAHLPGTPRPADPERARGVSGFAYRGVRAVTGGVGRALDAALGRLVPALGSEPSSTGREAVLAAVNGVLGDYLHETANPLAIPMRLRRDGRPLDTEGDLLAGLEEPTSHVLVLVHGLCRNDLQWRASEGDPVGSLARARGFTPLHLHYNSGLHVSANGREFADLLDAVARRWPVPLAALTIVAHSMGGLVARSACHHAAAASYSWLEHLDDLVFIATPHHGAPLERGGNRLLRVLGATPYAWPLARLGKVRSAGITDLRHGNLLDEDWQGHDRHADSGDRRRPVPLPEAVRCYAIAGSTGPAGDGLVPLDSALGRHADPAKDVGFTESRRWIADGVGHVELLTRPEVWERIAGWLEAPGGET